MDGIQMPLLQTVIDCHCIPSGGGDVDVDDDDDDDDNMTGPYL